MHIKQLLKNLLLCLFLFACSLSVYAQETTVTGKVTDEKGLPIPGSTIQVKGSKKGTNANPDGSYAIVVSARNILVFSSVGYTKQEIPLYNQKVINIQLVADQQSLNEVVVVGYGTQKRRDLTGSVGSVKSDEFKSQPITNPTEALQGRISGVNVVKSSGAPDATPTIVIRGLTSLNQPNPLYIIDGARVPDGNNLNVQDIATIDVLKDASAAAIYGAAAAGGVIVITTKKGVTSTPSVNFSTRYGITKPKLIHLLDTKDFIRLQNIVNPTFFQNADGTPKAGIDTLVNTDWTKALYRNAYEQNYNLSVSGASPTVNYLFSGFYNKQKGIYIKNYSNIAGARINTDYKLSKWLKVGEQLAISQRITAPPVGSEAQLHNAPFRSLPLIPIKDKYGNYGTVPQGYGNTSQFGGTNPVGTANYADAINYKNNLQSSVYAEITLPADFSFRTSFSYSYNLQKGDTFQNSYSIGKITIGNNSLNKFYTESTQTLSNYVLSWNHSFGKHNLNAIAGFEQIVNKYSFVNASMTSIGQPGYSFLQTTSSNLFTTGNTDNQGLIKSLFARLNYNFNNRYYVSGSIRRDANGTVFGPNRTKGTFSSASAGWNISEESFFKPLLPAISLLKLRASYGELGNSNVSPYLFNSSYGQFFATNGISGGAQNFIPGGPLQVATTTNTIANPDLHWETVKETNIGLDGAALNNKLYFSAEYYSKTTAEMLYNIKLALSSGYTAPYIGNVGKVSSKGFDFLVGYRNSDHQLGFDISVTAGFNKNKVLNLNGLATDAILDGYNYYNFGDASFSLMSNQNLTITKAGVPFGSFYGYKVTGIFKTDAEATASSQKGTAHAGDLIYDDRNHDGKIDNEDRQVIGNPNPKLIYGISARFTYKGFDANFLFNGVAGVDLFNAVKAYEMYPFADGNTTSKVFGSSFLGGNGLTSQPRLGVVNPNNTFTLDPNGNYNSVNSYFVENGSYLKLKNLQIGYTFSNALLQKAKIKTARVFIMGNNLFTITKYTGLDPELGSAASTQGYPAATTRGIDAVSQYPQTRIYSVGLDITF